MGELSTTVTISPSLDTTLIVPKLPRTAICKNNIRTRCTMSK